MSEELKNVEDLARSIVLAQGNIFIKELLREKKITIGATKADFEKNLLQAIADGQIGLGDLKQWLEQVEGWGDQHVYLFKMPKNLAGETIWSSEARLRKLVDKAGMGNLWGADSSLVFPEERELTEINFRDGVLRFVWHVGLQSWMRAPAKDIKDKVIEGDTYWFRAYRERRERAIMRFELRPADGLAAAFIQTPFSPKAHDEALEEVSRAAGAVVDFSKLKKYSTSRAILQLDQKAATQSTGSRIKVKAERTRMNDGRAHVEFAGPNGVYRSSNAVLQVRQAVTLANFSGNTGVYLCEVPRPKGGTPEVKIELFGETRRIRLWAQLGATAVWDLLRTLKPLG